MSATAASTLAVSRELDGKLATVRRVLERHDLVGVRLRGVDWLAWATCGGSNAVMLTSETGVAEVLLPSDGAWVLNDYVRAQ